MIFIRGDGNARIGVGHLMRCITIAEELALLQGNRENICFVCADEDSGAFVRENGFRSLVLGTDYRDMESELPLWKKVWEELLPGEAFRRQVSGSLPGCAGKGLGGEPYQGSGSQGAGMAFSQGDGSQGAGMGFGQGHGSQGTGMGFGQGTGAVISQGIESQGAGMAFSQGHGSQGAGMAFSQGDGSQSAGMGFGQGTGAAFSQENGEATMKRVIVLVDSYYVTDTYLAALGKTAYTVLMDDYGSRRYPVDCIINYNAPADLEAYQKLYQGSRTRLLVGSAYTPLRRQFREAGRPLSVHPSEPAKSEPLSQQFPGACGTGQEGSVREVLITTGGGDIKNIAGKILKRIYSNDFTFHLVTGRFNPNFQELKELEKKYANIKIHYDVKDMAGLMGRCQLALTAGGSTIYELAALGVPFICFSYAENQEALVEYIGSRQIAGSAGAWHREPERTLGRIEVLFEELAGDPIKRECCRRREKEMADGEGAGRLARELLKQEVGNAGTDPRRQRERSCHESCKELAGN